MRYLTVRIVPAQISVTEPAMMVARCRVIPHRSRRRRRDVEVGEAQRAAVRVPSNVPQCALDGGDEASGDVGSCFGEEVVDSGLDVVSGEPAQPDGLGHDSGCAPTRVSRAR